MTRPDLIRLRYPATCASCQEPIAAGEQAHWSREHRAATCATCLGLATETPAAAVTAGPGAGASAQAVRDRSRIAREERARSRWGGLGVLAVQLFGDTREERNWAKGAKGERIVAQRLTKQLSGKGVVLLHDRRVPGTRANIDHLAIGPGGVTVIDAKHLKGKIRHESHGGIIRPRTDHLLVAGRDRSHLITGMHRQLDHVRRAVGEGVDVCGMLCLVDAEGLPLISTITIDGIPVASTRAAAKLAARPGPLTVDQVDELARRVAGAFPGYEPS